MKLSTYLVLAVSYLGASAATIPEESQSLDKRACFLTGATYGPNKNAALDAARQACNGPLKGTYNKRETAVKCYNIGSDRSVKLTVGLTGKNAGATRYIGPEECYNGLAGRIKACPKGDDKTYGNWRYRADPNEGTC